MFTIPHTFSKFILEVHQDEGQIWLDRLPAILTDCEQRWGIIISPPFPNLSYHYVAPAQCNDGTPVVIKACAPTGEFEEESEALRLFNGQGMVKLLASDPANEVMLLERLHPGTTLVSMVPKHDKQATSILAGVMRQLWRPAPQEHHFPTVQQWSSGLARLRAYYNGGTGPFPARLVEEAETLFAELNASAPAPMLLHGDLHHDNVLAAGTDIWRAIDPKGLVGDPAYEPAGLLHNPQPQLLSAPNPQRLLAHRIDQLAEELALDRARIRNWAVAQTVLATWWGVEDTGKVWQEALTCAELLSHIPA